MQKCASAATAFRYPACDVLQQVVMPKLYEYFGLIVMFYANEHDPVHVHGKFQGRESRVEPNEMQFFKELVTAKSDEIVRKWIDFFVLHKTIKPERITRRLK